MYDKSVKEKIIGKEAFDLYINGGDINFLTSKYGTSLRTVEECRRYYHDNCATEEQKKQYRIKILKNNGAQYLEIFEMLLSLDENEALKYLIENKNSTTTNYLHNSLLSYKREYWVTKDDSAKLDRIFKKYKEYNMSIANQKRALTEIKKTIETVINATILILQFTKDDNKSIDEYCKTAKIDHEYFNNCIKKIKMINDLYAKKTKSVEASNNDSLPLIDSNISSSNNIIKLVADATLLILGFSKIKDDDINNFCRLTNTDFEYFDKCIKSLKEVNNLYDKKIEMLETCKHEELINKIKYFVSILMNSNDISKRKTEIVSYYYKEIGLSPYVFSRLVRENCGSEELMIAGNFTKNILSNYVYAINSESYFINHKKDLSIETIPMQTKQNVIEFLGSDIPSVHIYK